MSAFWRVTSFWTTLQKRYKGVKRVKLTIFTVTYLLLIKFQERAQMFHTRVNHFLQAIPARSISLGSEIFYPKLRGLKIFWKSTRVPKFSPDLFSKFLVFISKYTNEVILERQNNRKFKFSPVHKNAWKRIYILHTDHKNCTVQEEFWNVQEKFMYVQEKKAVQSSLKRSEKFPTKV